LVWVARVCVTDEDEGTVDGEEEEEEEEGG
jgi:hypothetical protein